MGSTSAASSSMGKKRGRERHQNPQPFLADDNDSVASKKRSTSRDARKQHQKDEKLLSSGMSSKILKEARIQQREVEDEEVEAQNPNNSLLNVVEQPHKDDGEEDDIDDFAGFSETQSRYGDYEVSTFFFFFLAKSSSSLWLIGTFGCWEFVENFWTTGWFS